MEMHRWFIRAFALVATCFVVGCADSQRLGEDGKPQAAGAADVRQAVRSYTESAPVRRVSQYSQAVAQGLFDPMLDNAKRQQRNAQASMHHMSPARPLADDEQCIGSSIVRVDRRAKVVVYSQVLQGGQPIYCGNARY